jgi:hypothetical protein
LVCRGLCDDDFAFSCFVSFDKQCLDRKLNLLMWCVLPLFTPNTIAHNCATQHNGQTKKKQNNRHITLRQGLTRPSSSSSPSSSWAWLSWHRPDSVRCASSGHATPHRRPRCPTLFRKGKQKKKRKKKKQRKRGTEKEKEAARARQSAARQRTNRYRQP